MKISKLVAILEKQKEEGGDLEVLVNGHPGERGCEIFQEDIFVDSLPGTTPGRVLYVSLSPLQSLPELSAQKY